ncbi:MAG: tRNA (adenosine(37)-N6)-threonylcarbamoyltransferase complex dimerization subunit type 1 TsaB [Actinomycetaceae bacterium]|nr:tRNA (adenosine(37)-N6)-threonylcarbamoyltransferase complex dimerization subunit type 1 TsaB [Actinomycetaceae bacterium]
MTTLTIDTSDRSIVGLVSPDFEELACAQAEDARHHVESLTPMVRDVVAGTRPDSIVVGTGPAAFTGLRAGLVTARALARGWGIPLRGVSSLEVLAFGAIAAGADEAVAAIDAKRGELFTLHARAGADGGIDVISGPRIVAPSDLPADVTLVTHRPGLYPELEDAVPGACRPVDMARLAAALLAAGAAMPTEPQYLRRPDVHGRP